ncbi:MAG: glycosyltransferase family 2 protein, partial [Chthoniobacterales bacterium]
MAQTISVVIPAYNRAGLIGDTLKSLFNQTLPATEIIVVDDGSTDFTAEAAESEFSVFSRQLAGKARIPEFKAIRQANAGPGPARNRGLREARGEFVHFFDSDDVPALNKHEIQAGALERTGGDIAFGPWAKGSIKERNRGLAGWPLG